MKIFPLEVRLTRLTNLSILLIPIAVFPPIVIDPFNVSKMIAVSGLGFTSLGIFLVLAIRAAKNSKVIRVSLYLLAIFLLLLLSSLFFSGAPFNQQLFGSFGRNIGLLSLLGLAGLFVGAFYSALKVDTRLMGVRKALFLLQVIGTLIAALQFFGVKFFELNEATGRMIGTQGNSNFQGIFLSILAIVTLTELLFDRGKISKYRRIGLAILFLLQSFLIIQTNALQSMLSITLISLFLIVYSFRFNNLSSWFKKAFVLLAGASLSIFLLLVVGLNSFFSQVSTLETLRIRTYYWHAGLSMMLDKPLFGVGLDSFGDWFLKYQSDQSYYKGVEMTDASHNVFIDFGAWGGIPLFIFYLAIQILVLLRIAQQLRSTASPAVEIMIPIGIWLVLTLQSLVTVANLGFYFFVALSGGWILGHSFAKTSEPVTISLASNQKLSDKRVSHLATIIGILCCSLAATLAVKEMRIVQAVKSNSARDLSSAASSWPELPHYSWQAAGILKNAGLRVSASILQKRALQEFPRFYRLHLLGQELAFSEAEREKYQKSLEILNPKR